MNKNIKKFLSFFFLILFFVFLPLSNSFSKNLSEENKSSKESFSAGKLLAKLIPNTFFKPVKVELKGNSYLSPQTVFSSIGLDKFNEEKNEAGAFTKIFTVSKDQNFNASIDLIKSKLFSLPWVQDAEIEKSLFPPSLKISIKEEVPWFVVERGPGKDSWLVSREGKWLQPLGEVKESKMQYLISSLPRLAGLNFGPDNSSAPGAMVSGNGFKPENYLKTLKEFKYATNSLQAIEKNGGFPFHLSRFEVLEGGVLIEPEDFKRARAKKLFIAFEKEEQLKDIFLRYSLVRKDLNQRGLIAEKLDLRFDGRVVVADTKF